MVATKSTGRWQRRSPGRSAAVRTVEHDGVQPAGHADRAVESDEAQHAGNADRQAVELLSAPLRKMKHFMLATPTAQLSTMKQSLLAPPIARP